MKKVKAGLIAEIDTKVENVSSFYHAELQRVFVSKIGIRRKQSMVDSLGVAPTVVATMNSLRTNTLIPLRP